MAVESIPVTVEVLTKALQSVAPPWYASGPFTALLGVVVGALIGFGGNWYLKRMDRDSWVQQNRWQLKWQIYSQLAEHLGELHSLITEAIALTASGPQPGETAADYDAHVARRRTAIQERAEKFRQYGSVARLVVPAEVRTFLTNFGDSWNGATTNEARNAVARNAWLGILDRARADLMTEDA